MVAIEESGIFDGAVVVDLAPALIEESEDASGANGEIKNGGWTFVAAAFPCLPPSGGLMSTRNAGCLAFAAIALPAVLPFGALWPVCQT